MTRSRWNLTRMLRAPSEESGNSAISFIFAFPLVFILLLGIIEVGWNFRTRALVQGVVRDVTRGAAADGGDCNPATNSNTAAETGITSGYTPCTGSFYSWSDVGTNLLRSQSRKQYVSTSPPTVTCTPDIAARAGAEIKCTVTYQYKSLTQFFEGTGRVVLGINRLVDPFKITYYGRAETGATS